MTADFLAPFIRILLRWIGGMLITAGYAHNADLFSDPDLVTVFCYIGAGLCGLISEGWWLLARRYHWSR